MQVFLFSYESLCYGKGVIWVGRDEISHFVRNDKDGALVLIFRIVIPEKASSS